MANKIEKQFSADNMKLIINVLTGLMASTDTLSEKCIDDFDETKTYPPKSVCIYNGYLWQSITTAYGAWDENKWKKLSDDFTELTVSDIQSWIGLSQEQLETMTNLISTEIRLDKVFSSSETYTRIDNALKEAKQYCVSQLNEMKQNFQDGVDTVYDAVIAKGTTPVDKTPSEIAIAISKLGGELTSIYNALITQGLPMTGEESEDQIAAIITDLMTINVTTKTDSNTFVFNGTKEIIKETELVDTSSGLILEFNSEELTSVELGDYIEFAEIDKTEYNNKIKFM